MSNETIGLWYYESDGPRSSRTHYAVRRDDNKPCGTDRKDFPSRSKAIEFIDNANRVCISAGLGLDAALRLIEKARRA